MARPYTPLLINKTLGACCTIATVESVWQRDTMSYHACLLCAMRAGWVAILNHTYFTVWFIPCASSSCRGSFNHWWRLCLSDNFTSKFCRMWYGFMLWHWTKCCIPLWHGTTNLWCDKLTLLGDKLNILERILCEWEKILNQGMQQNKLWVVGPCEKCKY